jgi:flagellar biosynthesis anti-sigma factor FlgM
MQSIRRVGSSLENPFVMISGPDSPAPRTPSGPEEPTSTDRITTLLDHIRALDHSMDEARVKKIEKIKKSLADGTYHVSAAEVARKILDTIWEP